MMIKVKFFDSTGNVPIEIISNFSKDVRDIIGADFSKIIEESRPGTEVRYVLIYEDENIIGLCFVFNSKILNGLVKVSVFGHPFICADCGILLSERGRDTSIFKEICAALVKELRVSGSDVVLVKDSTLPVELFVSAGFCVLPNGPAMMIPNSGQWDSFEDYLSAMKSKYRKKIVQARKSLEESGITIQKEDGYRENISKLFSLYKNVSEREKSIESKGLGKFSAMLTDIPRRFKMNSLEENFFEGLEDRVSDRVDIISLKKDDEILAYTMNISDCGVYYSVFVGMHYGDDVSTVYRTLLAAKIEQAIKRKSRLIVFGRTSLLTKAELGGEAFPAYWHARVINPFFRWLNPLMKIVGRRLEQSELPVRNVFS